MIDYSVKGIKCWIDYFDSFRMSNRYNEPGKLILLRSDNIAEVEIEYPVRKRVLVPFEFVRVETI